MKAVRRHFLWGGSDVELHKDLKVVTINTFKQRKSYLKNWIKYNYNDSSKIEYQHKSQTQKKETNKQVENLDLRTEITETGRWKPQQKIWGAEEGISKLEDKMTEIIQSGKQKE